MPLLRNIGLLCTCLPGGGQGEIHAVPRGAVAWEGEVLRYAGPEDRLPAALREQETWDAEGRMAIPGLVDCHTHLAFAGWRAGEFARRLRGESYLDVARSGGGIAATVARTRELGEADLFARAAGFLEEMARLGVTTVEAKSGYGLDAETELRLLRTYRRLGRETPMRVVSTYLGAHAVPPEYRERREEYLRLVEDEMIPRVARERLADGCDVCVEEGAFSAAEGGRVLEAGRRAGLAARVHADQLSACGGAELAAAVGALSADHLERVSDAGVRALAAAGTVAVSLPLAALWLGGPPCPARRLIEAGVPLAVATDFNPGTAPSRHLPLAMMLACATQRVTPAEALKGATIQAARALGLQDRVGSLEAGKSADLALVDSASPDEWLTGLGEGACVLTVAGGRAVWRAGGTR